MNKRILFVDDEPMILQGIQRSLRNMRAEWEIEFANSGAEALETMGRAPFDVVITDMRMPGMDGAQLLDQVKVKFPRTVRFVLSGQSDRETIMRSIGPTHQYLSKPCDVEELKQKLAHAFALRDVLADPRLKEIVGRLETVPSLPSIYVQMTKALQSPDASISEIASVISQDMGMSTKLLQLVNSAFFGLSSPVSSPKQAASLIGIDNIRALALSVQVFSRFEGQISQALSPLWEHSLATASMAKAIAQVQKADRNQTDDRFTAGLLHDVGRLIMASACHAEYAQVLQYSAKENVGLIAAEQKFFGCTHATVGAYLLGLWGLPDSIIAAAAWHHQPAAAGLHGFSPLLAAHVANHFDYEVHAYPSFGERVALDEACLTEQGLHAAVESWAQACRQLQHKGERHGG
jgi:putative nucleotidyltransferase with HDIG domain